MPDPKKETVSATQIAPMLNRGHWGTRFTLYHEFKGSTEDRAEDNRMSWGKKLQPLVLEQAAQDLKLEVRPVHSYDRHGPIGCTKDAVIICPDRGAGALETKCVFDYAQWGARWAVGKTVPFDYEAQLQAQMFVGAADQPFTWGIIAVWVCGEMFYFERKPIPEFWDLMTAEAHKFLDDVEHGNEPEPVGLPLEIPTMAKAWGQREEVCDMREDPTGAEDILEIVRQWAWSKKEASFHDKNQKHWQAKLLKAIGEFPGLLLPDGVSVYVKKSETQASVITQDMVGKVARKAGVRTTINVKEA